MNCKQCNTVLDMTENAKPKTFCSDACRKAYSRKADNIDGMKADNYESGQGKADKIESGQEQADKRIITLSDGQQFTPAFAADYYVNQLDRQYSVLKDGCTLQQVGLQSSNKAIRNGI